mmetsp:Transcript_8954/g.12327  ORF Transcript_8954/g.12327 Transcript_8954/m.12327 type:complete len:183 (-) Transcript_8954:279-827(-)
MRDFEKSEQGMTFKNPRLRAVDEECDNIDAAVVKATTLENSATLFSRVFGRGLDFKNRIKSMKEGVHVVQAFFSDSISEERQIKGRTARQGDKGSYEIIGLLSDVTEDLGLTEEELTKASDVSKSHLYDLIDGTRKQKIKDDLRNRMKKVEEAEKMHTSSMNFKNELLAGNHQKAKGLHASM